MYLYIVYVFEIYMYIKKWNGKKFKFSKVKVN